MDASAFSARDAASNELTAAAVKCIPWLYSTRNDYVLIESTCTYVKYLRRISNAFSFPLPPSSPHWRDGVALRHSGGKLVFVTTMARQSWSLVFVRTVISELLAMSLASHKVIWFRLRLLFFKSNFSMKTSLNCNSKQPIEFKKFSLYEQNWWLKNKLS